MSNGEVYRMTAPRSITAELSDPRQFVAALRGVQASRDQAEFDDRVKSSDDLVGLTRQFGLSAQTDPALQDTFSVVLRWLGRQMDADRARRQGTGKRTLLSQHGSVGLLFQMHLDDHKPDYSELASRLKDSDSIRSAARSFTTNASDDYLTVIAAETQKKFDDDPAFHENYVSM